MNTSTWPETSNGDRGLQILSKKQVISRYAAISKGWLNKALRHRGENGLDQCIIRLGRLVCFDQHRFEAWLEGFREVKTSD